MSAVLMWAWLGTLVQFFKSSTKCGCLALLMEAMAQSQVLQPCICFSAVCAGPGT